LGIFEGKRVMLSVFIYYVLFYIYCKH